MNFVFVSYNYGPHYPTPEDWLKRVKGYIGVLECLSTNNNVTRVKQIDYECERLYNGVQYRFVNYGDKGLKFPFRLHRFIKSLNPDVVIVHGLHNPLQVVQLRMQLNSKVKIIAQNHAEKPAPGIRKLLQRIADRYIDAYLFASYQMGVDWVNQGNLASAHKIHEVMEVSSVFYTIDKPTAVAKTKVLAKPAYLWVGRLNPNKDPLNVVKAFLQFTEQYPDARLYMIYHTDELLDDVKQIINNHAAGSQAVILIGQVPNEDLLYWYNSVDFLISGSYYEGSGTAVCEAMSCGCIPIVTDILSFKSLTDHGRCGILYEPGNQNALRSALQQSLQLNMEEKRALSLQFFKSNLSFNAIARRIEQVAESLL